MTSPILTVRDLAAYLKVSRSTIYRWLKRREGPPSFRIGSDFRFNIEAVDEWMRLSSEERMHRG